MFVPVILVGLIPEKTFNIGLYLQCHLPVVETSSFVNKYKVKKTENILTTSKLLSIILYVYISPICLC